VHRATSPAYAEFWSVIKHRDIMQVTTSQQIDASDTTLDGIALMDQPSEFRLPNLIAMHPLKHDEQRQVISPIPRAGKFPEHGTQQGDARPAVAAPRAHGHTATGDRRRH
jgi:cytochrome P450